MRYSYWIPEYTAHNTLAVKVLYEYKTIRFVRILQLSYNNTFPTRPLARNETDISAYRFVSEIY